MVTLGIETSCDETSVAILDDCTIVINEIFSQKEHARFGGVVPEIASRAHIKKIDLLCASAFKKASMTPHDVNLIAVTDSPGLAGALLVGISFALGLSVSHTIPVTGVNHLEGHICSVLLENPECTWPFIALVVSGGHTAIYRVESFGSYECLGQTIDDAAGEAFDKVGKMLGFTYPAGRAIEQEAAVYEGDNPLSLPIARCSTGKRDFSFSGLKTAAKYHIQGIAPNRLGQERPRICKALQEAIVQSLVRAAQGACGQTGIGRVALVGGVACNGYLRHALKNSCGENVYFPSPRLCTDNAAMIARAGLEMYGRGLLRYPHMDPSRTPQGNTIL